MIVRGADWVQWDHQMGGYHGTVAGADTGLHATIPSLLAANPSLVLNVADVEALAIERGMFLAGSQPATRTPLQVFSRLTPAEYRAMRDAAAADDDVAYAMKLLELAEEIDPASVMFQTFVGAIATKVALPDPAGFVARMTVI